MASPALAPQSKVGPYVLLERLGVGGIGEVWKARDTRLSRVVALKFITAEGAPLGDLLREARAVSALNHPNIVTIFEVGDLPAGHYLIMEFVSGESLRGRMRRAPVPLPEALDISRQIASALAAAHKHGVVHRDLKPENIMLREDGVVKLVDFGLAKQLPWAEPDAVTSPSLSSSGQLVGTYEYMAPEQARGKSTSPATDVFAFGIVVYEMIAGEHPFRAESTIDTLTAILNKEPQPVRSRRTDVPPAIEDLLQRALSKEPEKRFDSGVALASALETSQRTEAPRQAPRAKPRWMQAIGAALILVVLAAMGWIFRPGTRAGVAAPVQTVLVLKFRAASGDQRAAAIVDELAEDLDGVLSQNGLRVASRTLLGAVPSDARTAGAQIGVDAVLDGTVRSYGDKLRIHVELVSTRTGFDLWSQNVTAEFSEPIASGEAAAQQVGGELKKALATK